MWSETAWARSRPLAASAASRRPAQKPCAIAHKAPAATERKTSSPSPQRLRPAPLRRARQLPQQIGIAAGGQTVTAFSTTALAEGAEVFVIATGLLSKAPRLGDGFSLLAVGPKGALGFIKQNPSVYTLHASPDAPAVDAFVGTEKLVDNLAFGRLARSMQVPPGEYTIDIFGHTDGKRPTTAPVASKKIGPLGAGERYLAVASGFLLPSSSGNEPGLRLDTYADEFAADNATGAGLRDSCFAGRAGGRHRRCQRPLREPRRLQRSHLLERLARSRRGAHGRGRTPRHHADGPKQHHRRSVRCHPDGRLSPLCGGGRNAQPPPRRSLPPAVRRYGAQPVDGVGGPPRPLIRVLSKQVVVG